MNHPIIFSLLVLTAVMQVTQVHAAWQKNRHHDPRQWTACLIGEAGLLGAVLLATVLAIRAP